MSGILPRDENHVTAVGFESSTTPGLILPGKINPATGRILTSMTGSGSGTVQTIGVTTANGFSATSDGDPVEPRLTLTTTIAGILYGNGTAISALTVGSGLSLVGTTLSATGGGSGTVTSVGLTVPTGLTVTGSPVTTSGTLAIGLGAGYVIPLSSTLATYVVGPASATDNAIARFDGTTGKLIQNTTMLLDDSGNIIPVADGTQNIGKAGTYLARVFTNAVRAKDGLLLESGGGVVATFQQAPLGTTVNYLGVNGAATTDGIKIYSFGSDTNIDIDITPKGTGVVNVSTAVTVADEVYGAGWNGSLEVPTKNALYDKIETLGGATPASAYYFVAADDATTKEKALADYVCDGTADEVQINLALDAIRATGGKVILSSGTFAIAASINMLGNVAESDANPFMTLLGSGSESTTLVGASNVNVIATGQRAKYEIAYFTAVAAGSGDCISQTAGTERGNWQSWIHDVYLQGNFVDHTGWGLDLQSPFRMRLTNIEMNGVANGCNFVAHTNAFNPGNLTVDRMFINLWNDASNASAIGFQLAVQSTTAENVMNLVAVKRLDIAGGTALTSSIGISIVGASSSFGDSRHHSFTNLNIEDVQTVIKHVRGRDCTYRDLNYCRPLSGGTVIDLDSTSHNNSFENLYAVAQGSGQTFNLIVDNNGSSNLPNSLTRVDGFQPSSVTINATLASNTILERVDLSGGSPTVSSTITDRNNGSVYLSATGNNKVYGTNASGEKVWKDEGVTYSLVSEASSATPTATTTADRNEYVATALTANAELQLPSGTPKDNCMVLYNLKASGGTRTITRVSGLTDGGKTRAGTIATGETLLELYKRIGTTYVCVDSQVIPA